MAGLGASLLLIPVTLIGAANATGQVAETARAVDDRVAAGVPLVEAAAQGAGTLATAARTIAETAEAAASGTGALGTAVDGVAGFVGPYASFSDSYEAAADAIETAQSFAVLLPPGIGENLQAAQASLEARAKDLEDRVAALVDAPTVGVLPDVATGIADLARRVEAAMVTVRDGLTTIGAQLQRTRDAVSVRSQEVTWLLTILAVVISAWLAYTAGLNVALLRLLPARPPRHR